MKAHKLSSGRIILVGKNAEDNDRVVRSAQPEDYILHTAKKGSPFVRITSIQLK